MGPSITPEAASRTSMSSLSTVVPTTLSIDGRPEDTSGAVPPSATHSAAAPASGITESQFPLLHPSATASSSEPTESAEWIQPETPPRSPPPPYHLISPRAPESQQDIRPLMSSSDVERGPPSSQIHSPILDSNNHHTDSSQDIVVHSSTQRADAEPTPGPSDPSDLPTRSPTMNHAARSTGNGPTEPRSGEGCFAGFWRCVKAIFCPCM